MKDAYDLSKSIPNKLLNEDGSITDLSGNPVTSNSDAYRLAKALPNKVLMPDGTYATLAEVISGGGGTADIFIVVDTLPGTGEANKIYLVPATDGMFDEYFWNSNNKWDKLGTVDLSNCATKAEVEQCLADAKAYTDKAIENYVPLKSMDDYGDKIKRDGTTIELFKSLQDLNLPVGTMLLGVCYLTDLEELLGVDFLQEEIKIEVYNNNVIHGIMLSTNVAPYQWNLQYQYEEDAKWIPIVIQDGTASQTINTNIDVGNGKTISVSTPDGTSKSSLAANIDGSIAAVVQNSEGIKTEQIAYISDIDKKVLDVLGGEY